MFIHRLVLLLCASVLLATPVFAQSPRAGGTLNLIVNPEPPSINLGTSKLGPSSFVGSKLYEGLISLAPDLTPIPRLAQSWDISPDGKTYTFHLRPNVRWHDGAPFSAADVVFSFLDYLPATFARTRLIMERVEAIEAPNKFGEWRRGAYIKLVKNTDYWEAGKPWVDTLFFHIVPDAVGRTIAFESGRVDAIRAGDVENFDIARLAATPGVQLSEAGWEFLLPVGFLNMNLRNKPMDDLRFRQAVAHALDRQFIIKTIFSGFGRMVHGAFPAGYPFRDVAVETQYPYDPARARALLDDMGLLPDASGTRVSLRLLPLPYGETWQRLAEYTRARLNAVGIKTTLVATDVPGWFSRLSSGDFDLAYNFVYLLGDPAIGVNQTYLSTNQLNRGSAANVDGYVNLQLDALLLAAEQETAPAQRAALYAQVQKILSHDLPILWTHQMIMPTLYRDKVRNLISTGLGMNENFADVWLAS